MIQANDLRIGDLVNYHDDDIVFQVTEISKLGIGVKNDTEETWIEYDRFSPIKLTPELLEKCGFEMDGSYQCPLWKNIKGFEFWDEYGTGAYSYRFMNSFDVELKYLHQIQNLYFTITGSELEVIW